MAARYPEDGNVETTGDPLPWKCPLTDCPKAKGNKVKGYTSRKSLVRHLDEDHKDNPTRTEVKNSLPRELFTCKLCGSRGLTNLSDHQRRPICAQGQQQAQEPKKGQERTNNNFLDAYRKRLSTHGHNLAESTINDYTADIKKMIMVEVSKDSSFSAWCWLSTDPNQWKNVGVAGEYQRRELGGSSWKKLVCARQYLISWMEEEWTKTKEDPLAQIKRTKDKDAALMQDISRGRFKVAARQGNEEGGEAEEGGMRSKKTKKEGRRIDNELTKKIEDSWRQNPVRKKTLQAMAAGTFRSTTLEIYQKSDRDRKRAGWFLALQLFLNSGGTRIDPVRNVTVGAVKRARRVPQECPYCKEKRVFEEHKDFCPERERSLKRGRNKDGTVENGVCWYTLEVVYHKTKNKGKIHLVATDTELQAIRNWIERWLGDLSGLKDDIRPFEKLARWNQMLGTLEKLVDPELMRRAMGDEGNSLLISKSFRRYHAHRILKEGDEAQARLRGIGHSDMMAVKVYEDENNIKYLRGKDAERQDGHKLESDSDSDSDCEPDPEPY